MIPPLSWAGSKRWHAEQLRELIPADVRLVEPFAGSAAVSFLLDRPTVWLNDTNSDLMEFYRVLRAGDFTWKWSNDNSKEAYLAARSRFNALRAAVFPGPDPAEMAFLFYYLNQQGFNGLWRVNSKGEFNVPQRPKIRAFNVFDSHVAHELVKGWEVSEVDYSYVVTQLQPTDFVYADPPYDGVFDGYTADGFDWVEHTLLAGCLAKHTGGVVIMNAASPRCYALYRDLGYDVSLIAADQRMSHSQSKRPPKVELMAYRAPQV